MLIEPSHGRTLGLLMCQVTQDELWSPALPAIRQRAPVSTLTCRVGSGQATYHRFDPHRNQHLITYGKRMVVDKFQPERAVGWLSSREIRRRGYFDGQVSTLNLLAHTCCHEFAHLLQQVSGKRYRGSVHNQHFYRILDDIHDTGDALRVREQLALKAEALGVGLPVQVIDAPASQRLSEHWSVGDRVGFRAGRQRVEGKITRVNRKTCTVQGLGSHRHSRYRVPPQLLQRLSHLDRF